MTYAIRPLGRCRWSHVVDQFPGYRWYWCDLSGRHVDDPLPSQPPISTHAWGWGEDWVRLRIDGDQAIGAVLRAGAPIDAGWRQATVSQGGPVEAALADPSGGAPQSSTTDSQFTLRMLTCLSPVTLTFIDAGRR